MNFVKRKSFLTIMGLSIFISGCDQTGTIFKKMNINDGLGYSLDARQRTILVKQKAGPEMDRDVVCAEPSPDAIHARAAAIAAQAGAQGRGVAGQGGFGSSSAESAASLGLRTQTITILRDVLFRACEGYMNGVLDKLEYSAIVLNMDKVIVNALATDALAGTPVAAPVAIGTESSATAQGNGTGPQQKDKESDDSKPTNLIQIGGTTTAKASAQEPKIGNITVHRGSNGPGQHGAEALTRIATGLQRPNASRIALICLSLLSKEGEEGRRLSPAGKHCNHLMRHYVRNYPVPRQPRG